MSALTEWPDVLKDAAKTVKRVRSYDDPTAAVDPPAVIVGPPTITWDGYSGGPTSATYTVYVLEKYDARAVDRLLVLAPAVAAAITELTDAVVLRAEPTPFTTGSGELPAYAITVEVSLT